MKLTNARRSTRNDTPARNGRFAGPTRTVRRAKGLARTIIPRKAGPSHTD